MTAPNPICILVADIADIARLGERMDAEEVRHAVDRCLNRIDRVIESNGGARLVRDPHSLCASFEHCDAAVLAACEMLERVASLPPISGIQLATRVGVHYGMLQSSQPPAGDGLTVARRLAASAQAGQALASSAAVMQLSAPARHFARLQGSRSQMLEGLDGPVFELGHKPDHIGPPPAGKRAQQQLQIIFRNQRLLVDEQHPVLLIGREHGNDVVIDDRRASRQHARIERRSVGFYLIDRSRNGTYVTLDGRGQQCLKLSEIQLDGPGRLGCGFSTLEKTGELVFFELL
ncbi:hypothetical protein B4966_00180 [Rhodocyclaceae bacterium]|jgi:class 3 adenylate cyclase|nr:hypothetical protein B4966_00180 [Rhodocyclaceae bacterium]